MHAERLVAHRGYTARYPENTLIGIQAAIDQGARWVEIDILFSADGVPMIYHDSTLERVSGLRQSLHELTAAELQHINAAETLRLGIQFVEERIAPLSAVIPLLHAHPEVTLFVELKRAGLRQQGRAEALATVCDLLAEVSHRCVLISFDYEVIEMAHSRGWPQVGLVIGQWEDRTYHFNDGTHPDYLFIDQHLIPPHGNVNQEQGLIVIYEVSNAEDALGWYQRGADLLETFDLPGIRQGLASRTL